MYFPKIANVYIRILKMKKRHENLKCIKSVMRFDVVDYTLKILQPNKFLQMNFLRNIH